jgi:predicted transcriptional regulator
MSGVTVIGAASAEVDMEVRRMMVHDVKSCHAHDSLNVAAQIMWECACGCVPVVDEHRRPVGFLTDRDICMAAYTQGGSLQALRVETAMARNVISCCADGESPMRPSVPFRYGFGAGFCDCCCWASP